MLLSGKSRAKRTICTVFSLWKKRQEGMLERPLHVLNELIKHKHALQWLQLIVPRLVTIFSPTTLIQAARSQNVDVFRFCFRHRNQQIIEGVPTEAFLCACEQGDMNMIRTMLSLSSTDLLHFEAYQVVFVHGHSTIVDYFQSLQSFTPSEDCIREICKRGHVHMMKYVKPNQWTPDHLVLAIRHGQSAEMVITLHTHLKHLFVYTSQHLDMAISSKNEQIVFCVFEYGQFTSLTDEQCVHMVRNQLREAMNFFYELGILNVYSDRVFLEACRLVHLPLLQDILRYRRLPEQVIEEGWNIVLHMPHAHEAVSLLEHHWTPFKKRRVT